MGALDDAVARIRGPRIEDYFSPDADQSYASPTPAMDPAALPAQPEPPDQNARTWGQTLARGGALGLRLAGSMAPRHLRPLTTTAVEGWAETLDYADTGEMPSLTRGTANVAFGNLGVPGIDKLAPTPVRQFLMRGAENIGLTEAYKQTAYRLGFGNKPTLKGAVEDAPVSMAWTGVFQAGSHLVNAAHQHHADAMDLHVKAATDPEKHGGSLQIAEDTHERKVTQLVGALDPDSPAYASQAKKLGEERLSPELRTPEGVDAEYEKMLSQRQNPTGFRPSAQLAEAGIGNEIEPQPSTPGAVDNASGESAASVEALNRQKSEAAQGIQRLRVDGRTGKSIPLIGPDAVDATPGPHDLIVTDQGGTRKVLSAGAKVTTAGRVKALRPGQAGELRLSLVTDALFKAAKGVKNLKDYTEGAVAQWGEHVRPFLSGAWRQGAAEAAKVKRPGPTPEVTPAVTPKVVDADLLARIDAKAAAAGERKGWTDPKVKARLEATEQSTINAINAPPDPTHTPDQHAAKQNERMLRLRAITAEREGRTGDANAAWAAAGAAKKANVAGNHAAAIAIGKRHGLTTRSVLEAVGAYADPVDQQNALRSAVAAKQGDNSWASLLRAGTRWSFLGKPRVALKIGVINPLNVAGRALATLPGAAYSRVMHRGNQHVFTSDLTAGQVGYFRGIVEHGIPEALDIIKHGLTKQQYLEGKYGKEYHGSNEALNAAVNAPTRALGAVDHLIIQPWGEKETAALMHTNARAQGIRLGKQGQTLTDFITRKTDQWRAEPPQWAREFKARTVKRLSDSYAQGPRLEKFIEGISQLPVVGDAMKPFLRTILAGTKKAIQFTPAGLRDVYRMRKAQGSVTAAEKYGKSVGWSEGEGKRALFSGALPREEAMRFGEAAVGTLVVSAATAAILHNAIIGSPPVGMSSDEVERLGNERPWRSLGGKDIVTTTGPWAPTIMAIADGIGQYQYDAAKSAANPAASKSALDEASVVFGQAYGDLVQGIPIMDQTHQYGFDGMLRTLVSAIPFVPAATSAINAVTDPIVRKQEGFTDVLKANLVPTALQKTPLLPKLSGTGQPIEKRGIVNPFSLAPTHPDAVRTHAASVGVRVSSPNMKVVKTWDDETLGLPVAIRRVAEQALGNSQGKALRDAYEEAHAEEEPAEAARIYKQRIGEYRKTVMDNLRDAVTDKKPVSIKNLMDGLD